MDVVLGSVRFSVSSVSVTSESFFYFNYDNSGYRKQKYIVANQQKKQRT